MTHSDPLPLAGWGYIGRPRHHVLLCSATGRHGCGRRRQRVHSLRIVLGLYARVHECAESALWIRVGYRDVRYCVLYLDGTYASCREATRVGTSTSTRL